MRVGPSQEEIRRSNLGALLRSVHLHGAMARADLTTSRVSVDFRADEKSSRDSR